MSADYSRIHRLLRILLLIQSEPGWNADRLAAECGTAVRTIYRDLDVLEGIGVPYHYDDASRGYVVRRDFFMPPVELTMDEALALIAVVGAMAEREQVPFLQPAAKAIAKVRSQLPPELRDAAGEIEPHVTVHLAQAGSGEGLGDVYESVRRAIVNKRALRCSYESLEARHDADRAREIFHFHPYCLLFSQRAWYAVGYHEGRDGVRKLKLNRFLRIEPTDRPYAIPDDFSLEDHLGLAWRMIRGDTRYDVELWFDAAFAENIADTHWHSTQEIELHDDDSITFRCTVDGLDEIVWWVLSMGPHCVVRKPAELADRVRELAQQTAAHYAPTASPGPATGAAKT